MNVSPAPWTPSLLYAGGGSEATRRNVVVPLLDGTADERTVKLAASLAAARGGEAIIVNAVVRPSGTPLDITDELLDEHRTAARRVLRTSLDSETEVRTRGTARAGRTFSAIVEEASEDFSAGILVLDESEPVVPFGRPASARVAGNADSDIVTVGGKHASSTLSSVLVPVAGGPHSGLAVDVARSIAEVRGAWIELLHVVEEGSGDRERDDAEEYVAAARERLGEFEEVDSWVLEADDPADAIVEQSRYYDATVMGAPRKNRLREFVFGSTTGEVRSEAYNTVVTVERPHERDSLLDGWL
ncbi:universal stress protein [Haladaptatus salinisoli]|uniref:universal stress protein n=1 Tax=Haladaptatus salinisoli TaxID=2884876 RepID=UPI001D09FFB1|nr:universal stress protein [Haladaptatus salinisoli]